MTPSVSAGWPAGQSLFRPASAGGPAVVGGLVAPDRVRVRVFQHDAAVHRELDPHGRAVDADVVPWLAHRRVSTRTPSRDDRRPRFRLTIGWATGSGNDPPEHRSHPAEVQRYKSAHPW